MIIVVKTNFYSDLCKKLGLPLSIEKIINLPNDALLENRRSLQDEITLIQSKRDELSEFLKTTFQTYKAQMQHKEKHTREKYRDSLTTAIIKKKMSTIDHIKIRNYQKESLDIFKKYDSVYRPTFEQLIQYKEKIKIDEQTVKKVEIFSRILEILKRLQDFEGSIYLFDNINLVLSTSGIHIVYNSVPEKRSEDGYRNTLVEAVGECFNTYLGKAIDFIIEVYSLDQYSQFQYEKMSDNTDLEDISYFTKIIDKYQFPDLEGVI